MSQMNMFIYEYYRNEEKARKRRKAAFEKHIMDNKARIKADEAKANSDKNR